MPGKPPANRLGPLLALALAGLVVAAAGCGSDGDGSIPPGVADDLVARVDAVEQAVEAGDCDLAEQQAEALVTEVGELPGEVESEVERGLRAGAAQLAELTAEQCEQTTGATGFEETEPVEPAPEEEAPPEEEIAPEDEDEEQQPGENGDGEDGNGEGGNGEGEQSPGDGGGGGQPPGNGGGNGGGPPTGGTGPDTGGVVIPESGAGASQSP